MRGAVAIATLVPVLALGACAAPGGNAGPPSAPGVVAVPSNGKQLPEFQGDDAACRAYAGQQTGGPALANNGYTPGTTLQQRYDIAYTQCMYSKGNTVLSSLRTGPLRMAWADYDDWPYYPYYGGFYGGSAVFVNGGGFHHHHGFHHGFNGSHMAFAGAHGWTGGHGWAGGRGWAAGRGPGGGHGPGGARGGAVAAGGAAGGGHGGGRG